MTQLRVRQGLDGVRSLLQKENRLEAKVALESMNYDVGHQPGDPHPAHRRRDRASR